MNLVHLLIDNAHKNAVFYSILNSNIHKPYITKTYKPYQEIGFVVITGCYTNLEHKITNSQGNQGRHDIKHGQL